MTLKKKAASDSGNQPFNADAATAPESGLHDHLAFWLHRLSASVLSKFENSLLKLGVTVAQWQIMISIYHEDATTPKDLAAYIGIDAAAVSRGATRLLAKGLVKKTPHPEDRRSIHLALTAKGLKLLKVTLAIGEEQDALWKSSMTAQQEHAFVSTLRQLLEFQEITPTGNVWPTSAIGRSRAKRV
ncbi:MarR family winged helix-turn-helix transcriptional regulator [Eoetvoesiella caeni]|uniref:DNA-binding MarR family transcriptional regulator n=1 Tax=Eoetvoesiella caeni TaxID=645616 RepID=A0A366H0S5_9BURK|nr:MarR family transcriptional regulator [Eoetvoesiella caeni]MCI2810992.1 MarR family transcriptional regulator [Eoetvoesiella caeni]NYT56890.1 MarR family transcriptional regulator [Eoetvoesiella caeni]RBP35458.1 DNA-binding MarR family transcriptional regulator [Eoetvoesiella caeni]